MRQAVGDEKAAAILIAAKGKSDPAAYIAKAIAPKVREAVL